MRKYAPAELYLNWAGSEALFLMANKVSNARAITATYAFVLLAATLSIGTAGAQTAPRSGLIEEFSSSSCPPCATMFKQFHPASVSIHANDPVARVNVISYQLNFPRSNNPSYNQHAQQRYDNTGTADLPTVRVNGVDMNTTASEQQFYSAMEASRDKPSQFEITGFYSINGTDSQLDVHAAIKPLVSMSGNFRVHMAVVERHYTNTAATIDMKEYYSVMRRMIPDGDGRAETNWTANKLRTYTYSFPFAVSNPPAQGSFDFWGNPYMSDLIVFIEERNTREILQSGIFQATWPLDAGSVRRLSHLHVYPNPARDLLHVGFTTAAHQEVACHLTDMFDRVVYRHPVELLQPGAHQFNIPVGSIAAGIYQMRLCCGSDAVTRPVVIAR